MLRTIDKVLTESSKEFDIQMLRVDAYTKSAIMEAAIAVEEAELKYMSESTDYDGYSVLVEETSDGFVGKARNAIAKIIEAVKNFFKAVKEKIVSIFTSAEAKTSIDNLEAKSKHNPFFKSKKVEVEKTEDKIGVIQAGIDKMKAIMAKITAGRDVEDDEIEEVKENTTKKVAAIGAATVGAAAAIVLVKKRMGKAKQDTEKAEKDLDALENVETTFNKNDNLSVEQVSKLKTCASWLAAQMKAKGSFVMEGISKPLNAIKAVFSKKGGSVLTDEDKDNMTNKSFDSMDESSDPAFESTGDPEIDAELKQFYAAESTVNEADVLGDDFKFLEG